jgi:hypothetical protein
MPIDELVECCVHDCFGAEYLTTTLPLQHRGQERRRQGFLAPAAGVPNFAASLSPLGAQSWTEDHFRGEHRPRNPRTPTYSMTVLPGGAGTASPFVLLTCGCQKEVAVSLCVVLQALFFFDPHLTH